MARSHILKELRFSPPKIKKYIFHDWEPFLNYFFFYHPRRSQLKYHRERSHDEKRPHNCTKCDKKFYKKSDLSNHTKLHLGLKEHSCRYCYRKFAHISNLNRHILTHKKEKPYSCQICGQRYPQLATLNQHLKKHDGTILPQSSISSRDKPRQRQFHCKYCHQKFPHKAELIQHQSEHAKESYPYTCKRCKKGKYNSFFLYTNNECRSFLKVIFDFLILWKFCGPFA